MYFNFTLKRKITLQLGNWIELLEGGNETVVGKKEIAVKMTKRN